MEHVEQKDRAWLETASTDETNAARERGALAEVLGGSAPADLTSDAAEITRADLANLSSREISEALAAGKLDNLLNKESK